MGNLSSQPLELRSQLAQTWLPAEKDPHVLVHRNTHEQVHRHSLRILLKDLPRETALFSSRIATHQPYVCRLLYFHPIHQGRNHETEREFREMAVYTDRFLRLREWSREKVALAVHGLRRLVSVHGPMRISEQMVCQNQYGEVKVWISENPANNHPDNKCTSEEQSMADLAAILTKRNQELANTLLGCLTLKEAAERINRPLKEEGHLQANHSHRDTAKKKENPDKTSMAPYKNVFGDVNEGIRSKPEPALTPKTSIKVAQAYSYSPFRQKEEEFNIQATNSITLGRGRDFQHPQKIRTPQKQTTPTKSHPKSRISNEGHMEQGRGIESNYRLNRPENGLEFNRKNGTNIKPQEPAKPFVYQPRFETANNISSHLGYASMKVKQENVWSPPAEASNLSSTVSYHNRRDARSGHTFNKDPTKSGGAEAITIINNNVSNYYNSVTHNHILSDSRLPQTPPPTSLTPTAATQQEAVHQFRTQSKKEDPQSISPHSSNQFFKNTFKGKEKFAMPNFLQQQQKKKPTSQWMEDPPTLTNKCRSNINLTKNDPIASNPQQSPSETHNYTSLHNIEESEASKKYQRGFNFNKNYDPTLSGHKSSTPTFSFNVFGPRTPPPASPQNFSAFQKGYSNLQFKMPLRTKTTEFYHKVKEGPKKDDLQNKSFTQHELEKSIYQEKQAEEHDRKSATHNQKPETPIPTVQKPASEPTILPPPSSPAQPESGKLQFKKQLRNQFKFLLGGGQAKEGKEKQEQSTRTTLNSKADESQAKQVNLKDKIFRKQTAFAQLKKQALMVLTDD